MARCGCPTPEELDALRRILLNTLMFPYLHHKDDIEMVAEALGIKSVDTFIAGLDT